MTSQRMNPRAGVGAHRRCRVERSLSLPQRPGACLLVAGGEERDQPEGVRELADDFVEGRGAVPERGRLLPCGSSASSVSSARSMPRGPFSSGSSGTSASAARASSRLAPTQPATRPFEVGEHGPERPPPHGAAAGRRTSPASRRVRAGARHGRGRQRAARAGGSRDHWPDRRPLRSRRGRRAARRPAGTAEELRPGARHVDDPDRRGVTCGNRRPARPAPTARRESPPSRFGFSVTDA